MGWQSERSRWWDRFRVKIEDGPAPGGFIPRTSIGFQVKKTDYTPGLIAPEMRPSGQLRASISDLIDEHGAYIIASSGADASYTALIDRLNAMRSAVADKSRHSDLHLDGCTLGSRTKRVLMSRTASTEFGLFCVGFAVSSASRDFRCRENASSSGFIRRARGQ
jgi:hypothetical protein